MTIINRQWILAARPRGELAPGDLQLRTSSMDVALAEGQVLLRNLYCMCAPTIRNWMDEPNGLYPSIALGDAVMGPSVGRVEQSRDGRFAQGQLLLSMSGWQDYAVLGPGELKSQVVAYPPGLDPLACSGVYGVNALTAYFGLLKVGQPEAGQTLVVSAAGGSTGSIVAQIGRIAGCRVIGIASASHRPWLLEQCGLDAVIDYRSEDVSAALKSLCPRGVDVFFDNVGGEILAAGIANVARRGRIVLCGQISQYNHAPGSQPQHDLMRLVYRTARMEGFLVTTFYGSAGSAIEDLQRWNGEGRLLHREDVRHGFDALPSAFADVFHGRHSGTVLVRLDEG